MNTTLKYVLGIVAVVVIGLAAGYAGGLQSVSVSEQNLGGFNKNVPYSFDQGFQNNNQTVMNSSGAFTFLSVNTDSGNCATSSWNPGSIASSSIDGLHTTSTDIHFTGAVMGDTCKASLSSATSSAASVSCGVSGTATATLVLANLGASALDVVTGTARVCITH